MSETKDWRGAAESLEATLAGPTEEQLHVAEALGVTISDDLPALVAAAILSERVAPALMRSTSDREPNLEALRQLEAALGLVAAPITEETSADVVSAWIQSRYMEKRLRGIRELQPQSGDVVRLIGPRPNLMIISSVDRRGRIHMKGGRGLGAWPDNLHLVAREGVHENHADLAIEVMNHIRNSKTDYDPNSSLLDKIAKYRLDRVRPNGLALQELEDILDGGDGSEGPLQRLIERHPQLLASTVIGNNGTYVIPQKALGSEFRADFIVLGINSTGPEWVLVEIEASKHNLLNRDDSLTGAVRHAVGQIQDWREWLTNNVSYAQQQLGLHGLTNRAPGLVIIGRAEPTMERGTARSLAREQQGISIHSWDWILRQGKQLADGAFPTAVYADGVSLERSVEELLKA
ncbi:Shedu anti-phage system protein SduA domain-containing protein [Glutamicibacter arilaitensis]|uniref:Shedu anti-phage system protein SduA domain-containing protein n=1 Tax=Glutamicibacter arilaitensis TaxID=256701 RepID=UPI003F9224F2